MKYEETEKVLFAVVLVAAVSVSGVVAYAKVDKSDLNDEVNSLKFNGVNKSVDGDYVKPKRKGYFFEVWATTKENADTGATDFPLIRWTRQTMSSIRFHRETQKIFMQYGKKSCIQVSSILSRHMESDRMRIKMGNGWELHLVPQSFLPIPEIRLI